MPSTHLFPSCTHPHNGFGSTSARSHHNSWPSPLECKRCARQQKGRRKPFCSHFGHGIPSTASAAAELVLGHVLRETGRSSASTCTSPLVVAFPLAYPNCHVDPGPSTCYLKEMRKAQGIRGSANQQKGAASGCPVHVHAALPPPAWPATGTWVDSLCRWLLPIAH